VSGLPSQASNLKKSTTMNSSNPSFNWKNPGSNTCSSAPSYSQPPQPSVQPTMNMNVGMGFNQPPGMNISMGMPGMSIGMGQPGMSFGMGFGQPGFNVSMNIPQPTMTSSYQPMYPQTTPQPMYTPQPSYNPSSVPISGGMNMLAQQILTACRSSTFDNDKVKAIQTYSSSQLQPMI